MMQARQHRLHETAGVQPVPDVSTPSGRLLIVSNRLPVTASIAGGHVALRQATGGLATGLRGWYSGSGGLWIGWPGDVTQFDTRQQQDLRRRLQARSLVTVSLTSADVEGYYEGFANRVLWPLFHYLIDRVPVDARGWDAYCRANETFAASVVQHYRPGDTIWVHDYQLMLVPQLLRQALPHARIGFFLHIPFPSSEVFRILPWRREVLDGLLGADLVGFHTFAYLRHFLMSLVHVRGLEADVDSVQVGNRRVALGVFPMGIDADAFSTRACTPKVREQAAAIRRDADGRQIVLGVDRLDYTKGIPRRLAAVERLLTREPALRDRIRYIQIAVPSRGMVDSYQSFRRQVEETVGRINGTCGTLRSTPIHYMHTALSPQQLSALYAAADVMLVTPLRDGMNLVAKEFVASRGDGDGVLVLSEFVGAASELGDALVVNPYDVDGTANAIAQALWMPEDERRRRMRGLRGRVFQHDIHRWAESFLTALRVPCPAPSRRSPWDPTVRERIRCAERTTFLLDYDGTLVPLAPTPDLAQPDAELLALLARLTRRHGIEVHVVSGRTRSSLDQWFGALPIHLWAEHGFWHRPARMPTWREEGVVPTDWMDKVYGILTRFTEATPGAMIERKAVSLAWHYRLAEPGFGERQAHELRMLLGDILSNQPLEVIEGHMVVEIRCRGVNKGIVARALPLAHAANAPIVAIGDDRTDEDLFRALPAESITIAVGSRDSCARYRLADPAAVRAWLAALAD